MLGSVHAIITSSLTTVVVGGLGCNGLVAHNNYNSSENAESPNAFLAKTLNLYVTP